ncbi:MAG: HAD-IIIC family phosphatase, partial [Terriglobales bacterium]
MSGTSSFELRVTPRTVSGPAAAFDPLELDWLTATPADFRQRLRAIQPDSNHCGELLHGLANHRADAALAGTFNRAVNRLRASSTDLSPLTPFRLSILSNATVDLIADSLPIASARHRVALDVRLAPYDQVFQQALDRDSELYRTSPDAILLMLDHRWYGLAIPAPGVGERIPAALARLAELLDALQRTVSTPIIVQTVAMPFQPLFGSFDRRVIGTGRDADGLNRGIVELVHERGCYLLDVAALCDIVGAVRFHDPVAWNLYKLPMASGVVPLYADWLGRLIGAMRGTSRKCLVLDLDNTLWGGVVGDDGLEGLRIGQGSAEGEAYLEIQRLALDLKRRGIILAVCSKNDEQTARSVFRQHPEMLLKESDIAVFQANWLDKPSNLEAIAKSLDIGVEALVLLDDNGAERAQVRAALPLVGVPEVGNDPAQYPALLCAAGYFEAVSYSDEDRTRAASYAANAMRAEVKATARDLGDYLQSLDMVISHKAFDAANRSRIAQLINKSNQFNLTTRRYSEPEVTSLESDASKHTFQTRLQDRFGDFGLIGVMIAATQSDGTWDVDTWLMSCRVLGRKVEWSMLKALVDAAVAARVPYVFATYLPTASNSMVAEHYDRLGFARIST